MSDEYTPTTEQVLDNYVEGMSAFYGDSGQVEYARQFDRWLAAHDAETRAKALEDLADRCTAASEHVGGMTTIAAFATAEAERIREDQ